MDWTLYQYRVDFAPQIDSRKMRKDMIRDQLHSLGLVDSSQFDGTMLFTLTKFEMNAGKKLFSGGRVSYTFFIL